jgi:hemolysin activation/secretion protein
MPTFGTPTPCWAFTSPSELAKVAIASATLRVPLYRQKIFWEGSILTSNTRNAPSQTPAGELNFTGAGVSAGGRAIWVLPSLSEYKQQASVGIERRQYRNTCTIGDLGSEGCGTAAASLDVLPLTLGYSLQKPGVLNASVQWVSNLPLGSAGNDSAFEASRPGALSHYHLLRANVLGSVALNADWGLAMRLDAQLAPQALVSAEQFGAGGGYSVRGYPERIVSGDSGALVSLEASTSLNQLLGMQASTQTLQASWFVDAATVRNRLDTACTSGKNTCSLWGTGFGLLWRAGKNTGAKFALARAGDTIDTTRAGDWRLHFNLTHSF